MKVRDLLRGETGRCSPETDLRAAAGMLWEEETSLLPVVDGSGRVVGVITDRDICMALARGEPTPEGIHVGRVMTSKVIGCHADDDVLTALETMRLRQVRRLPVLDGQGSLQGVLTLDDVARVAGPGRGHSGVGLDEVALTLKAVSTPSPGGARLSADSGSPGR